MPPYERACPPWVLRGFRRDDNKDGLSLLRAACPSGPSAYSLHLADTVHYSTPEGCRHLRSFATLERALQTARVVNRHRSAGPQR